ncbi:hypothetical protein HUG10_15030 [Halorarum halophilum]|uniref:histidine kinase n=1 Tax=Halorarum halophilum TaxID=2743090 RepID=A0A7D5GD63_9EURY|nr:ATP-binding protein [Halobaculum halophilum]QLG28772.1 hypothetical protein HUG10_15030 [Halobaculum halophilum]
MSARAAGDDPGRVGYLVHLLGLAIVLLAGVHVLLDSDPLAVEFAEAAILLVFAICVFFAGYRAVAERLPARDVLRIVLVGLGVGVVVGLLATLFLLLRRATGEPTAEAWFVLSIGWSLGASAGALVGYYLTEVKRERAAQELLTKRLTILQRVLRHNIRNEVTILRGLSDDLTESAADPETRGKLDTVDAHVDRVYRLSENAQLLSDLWGSGGTEVIDLAAIARREVAEFRDAYPEVSVDADLPDRAMVEANRHLPVAVGEVLENVAVHNRTEGLSVTVSLVTDPGEGSATLEIVDDGSRIPEDEMAVLSSDRELPLQHVTGLGLWVIYWVLDASGGRAEFANVESGGVAVRLTVPTT